MELLKNLGFEPAFFAAQIVNFLIIAFLFKKYLYKPILKTLKDRQRTISRGLEDAESARIALEKANEEKDKLIKAATLEAEKIIDETKKSADNLRQELNERARLESQKIVDQTKQAAALEFERAEERAKIMSLEISKKLLDRILSDIFTQEEKDKILTRNISKLKEYE